MSNPLNTRGPQASDDAFSISQLFSIFVHGRRLLDRSASLWMRRMLLMATVLAIVDSATLAAAIWIISVSLGIEARLALVLVTWLVAFFLIFPAECILLASDYRNRRCVGGATIADIASRQSKSPWKRTLLAAQSIAASFKVYKSVFLRGAVLAGTAFVTAGAFELVVFQDRVRDTIRAQAHARVDSTKAATLASAKPEIDIVTSRLLGLRDTLTREVCCGILSDTVGDGRTARTIRTRIAADSGTLVRLQTRVDSAVAAIEGSRAATIAAASHDLSAQFSALEVLRRDAAFRYAAITVFAILTSLYSTLLIARLQAPASVLAYYDSWLQDLFGRMRQGLLTEEEKGVYIGWEQLPEDISGTQLESWVEEREKRRDLFAEQRIELLDQHAELQARILELDTIEHHMRGRFDSATSDEAEARADVEREEAHAAAIDDTLRAFRAQLNANGAPPPAGGSIPLTGAEKLDSVRGQYRRSELHVKIAAEEGSLRRQQQAVKRHRERLERSEKIMREREAEWLAAVDAAAPLRRLQLRVLQGNLTTDEADQLREELRGRRTA